MRNRLAIEARPISTVGLQAAARSRAFGLIAAVILMIAATSWLATAAGARGMGGGSHGGSHGSHSFAGARSFGGAHSGAHFFAGFGSGRRFLADGRFGHFNRFSRFSDRRFRNRFDGGFNNGFFPFGFSGDFGFPFGSWGDFGWPFPSNQLIQPAVTDDPPVAPRPQRYEPPTVETTPSGVTIVRGPGSRHS